MNSETGTVNTSESDYKAFFKNAVDGFMYGGTDGFLKDFNPAFEKMTGYAASELFEIPFLELFHDEDQKLASAEIEKLTKNLETEEVSLRLIRKDNTIKWLSWRFVKAGDAGSFFAISRDVTSDMKEKQTEAMISTLVDNIDEIIVITSLEGHVKYLNKAGKELLKIDDQSTGFDVSIFDLFNKDSGRDLKELYFPVLFETGGISGEFDMKSISDDNIIPVDCSFHLIKDRNSDEPSYISIFARPISNTQRTESERIKLTSMVENAPMVIMLIDFEGNIKYTNKKDPEEATKWQTVPNVFEFIPDSFHDLFKDKMSRVINTGSREEAEIQCISDKNEVIWYECKLSASFDLKGRIDGINICSVDITKRKQRETELKAREEQLEIFIKHTPAAVAVFDTQMRYITYSDNFLQDYNLSRFDDIRGKYHYEVFPEIPEKWKAVHEKCLKGESISSEIDSYINKFGKTEYLKWKVIPWFIHDDEVGGMILFTELITDSILANKKLKNQAEELMQTNQDLEQFAFITSHDLQEPLRMVGNFVQLLERNYHDLLDEKGKTYIGYVLNSVYRMEIMIKDLLNYSKLRKEDAAYTSIEIQDIIQAALQSPTLKRKSNVRINVDPLTGQLYCNPKHIQLVFENLIDNCVKFNLQEEVNIDIKLHKNEDEWKVEVHDNGIGIDEKHSAKIFDIFQRLHHHSVFEGSGIGLSLCKKIVEKHEGEIWFKSTPGSGSSFFFTLPIK